MRIGILEPKDFSKKALNSLSKIGRVSLFDDKFLDDFLYDKEIVFIRLGYIIDKNFLKKAKELKFLCTPTTGLNHINIKECQERNIKIISLKGEVEFLSNIRATPEHTFGLVLSLLRNYKSAFLSRNNNKWNREKHKGFEVYQNSIGIIGLGRVGRILVKYFKAFGAKIYFYEINNQTIGTNKSIKVNSIDELITKSNIIILSTSYDKKNHEFFNKKYIDLLKDKYFINTARGEILDEGYLIQKIEDNHFKGVAIDVIQNEQLKNNRLDKLIELSENYNLIITPHIAGATYSSMYKTEEFIVEKLYLELL
jgi:D-3-phosphoglycerate dehydrogenase